MRSAGIFLLAVGFLLQVMSSSLILLNYELNTAYIIDNFCVNTDKPELKCNGKCHLSKQIQEDSENKSETPASPTELTTLVLAVQEIPMFAFGVWDATPCMLNGHYIEGVYTNHLQTIFHPPQI